ncbi:MAG: S41 family peptidase, partial [Nanoarchaeota archaeon]|nr:S41 family peptidase [Nanoarchaeota archaeon]
SILRTTSDSEFRYASWYMRGALLFDGLEHQVGRARLDAFLRELRETARPLTTGALRRRLRAALGQAAATWFEAELAASVPTRAWLVRRRAESAARTARLAELRFVTDTLERVYSHLALKQKRHGLDYGELRRTIEDRVTRAPTDAEHRAALTDLLAAFHDGHLKLLLRNAPPAPLAATAAVSHRMLPGRILLTRIARLFGNARAIQRRLQQGLARLAQARALVIDLRGNPGGSNRIAFDYVARLIRQPVVLGHSTVRLSPEVLAQRPHYAELYPPDPSRPGFSRPREARLEPDRPLTFTGPIVVLVDHGCYSACESTALALKLGGARLYGQPTGGGSANPMTFDLPHTPGKLQVPTWIFVKPNGEPLEDNGVIPHVVVPAGQDAQTVALAELRRRLKP